LVKFSSDEKDVVIFSLLYQKKTYRSVLDIFLYLFYQKVKSLHFAKNADTPTTKKMFFVFLLFAFIMIVGGSVFGALIGSPSPSGNIITFIGGKGKQYCGVDVNKAIQCNVAGATDDATQFLVEDLGDGTFALKSMRTGQYCHDMGDKVVYHSDAVGAHEKFHWIDKGNSAFALTGPKSGTKRLYCADEDNRVVCNRKNAGEWETFTIGTSQPLPSTSTSTSTSTSSSPSPSPAIAVTNSNSNSNSISTSPSASPSSTETIVEENVGQETPSLWQWLLSFLFSSS
jgi:hypothetical protein